MALLVHPIAVKMTMLLDVPVQYSGGQLAPLHKSSSYDVPTNYRDILLSNDTGKTIQALVRPPLDSERRKSCVDTSGLNNGSTETAHLYIRTVVELCKAKKFSVALIFADVKTAFAAMIRTVSFPQYHPPEQREIFLKRLQELGFDKTQARQAYEEIRSKYGDVGEQGVEGHLDTFLARLHSSSWFTLEGLSGATDSKSGTLAGTSLADLVFTRVITRILTKIRDLLQQAGLIYKIPLLRLSRTLGLVAGEVIDKPSNIYSQRC